MNKDFPHKTFQTTTVDQGVEWTKLRGKLKSTSENLRCTPAAARMTLPTPTSQLRVNVSGNATSTLGKIKNQLTSLTDKAWKIAANAKNALNGK